METEELIKSIMDGEFVHEELIHVICSCSPKIALCGKRLGKGYKDHGNDVKESCVVCHYMDKWTCPRCDQ